MGKDKRVYGRFLMGETDWRGNWVLFWWAGPCSIRLVLGSFKMSRSLHPPTRILKVYIDLTGFSHMFSPDSLNHTLVSYGFSFGKGFHCGDRGENIYFKDRGGSENPLTLSVQLDDQPAVMSSHWPPRALSSSCLYSNTRVQPQELRRTSLRHFMKNL